MLVGRHRGGALIGAEVSVEDIEWIRGFAAFLEHPDEFEITVHSGAHLRVFEINGASANLHAIA